jgi:hypothetical protein
MTLKRILLAVLCLSLLSGFAAANVIVKGTDTLYVIKKTAVAPVIDGVVDNVWKLTDAVWQTSYRNGAQLPTSWEDLSGWSKLLWDDNNLYGLFYVQDDVITNLATNDWERDAIEVYLDGDLSRGPSFDNVNDVQFVIKHYFLQSPATLSKGATYAIQDDTTTGGPTSAPLTAPSGYWVEFQVPLDQVGIPATPETIIGVEFQQDDNDDNLVRRCISKWYLQIGDDSWQVPSHWGKAILSGDLVSDAFILNKLPDGVAAPTLDGAIDDIYRLGNQVTQERRGNGNEFPVSATDFFWRFYGLYDDNNLYGLVEIYDDIITNGATNDWERDAAEVYVDGDNSKGPSFDQVNDWQTVIKHYFKDTPPATPLSRGVEYAFLDVAQADTSIYPPSGYNIEFKMPLDQAGVPASEGTVIGFEVQGDDNDNELVRKNVTKWWLDRGDDSWQIPSHWGTAILGPAAGTVGIKQLPNQVATRFNLAQNYPNPFNPTTTISYSVIKSEKVRLTVYNVLGVKVADLVNETKAPGTYTASFNASNLASGVYFYKLESGSNTVSKKMMLLK